MIKAVINTKKLIGNTLDSRDEAQKLFAYISANYELPVSVVFDFDDVDFMSRSFADEFHKLKMAWCNQHTSVVEIDNASVQILDILQAVARTQKSREVTNPERLVLAFTNSEQLYDYLLSV